MPRLASQVNGERIFILGTNWVPLDAYHARDRERLDRAVEMVVDLGCNLVRCWGGNVYEDDRFFDLCDEAGILVWQDFAMACAVYPQDDAFGARLRDEVRAVVRRLRQHPSLALWAGDNECDETWVWTGGRRRDPNRNVLTRSVIPGVLREEDPSRPYLPSSPYVDDVAFASGRRLLPEDHLWGPRDDYKGAFYTESVCHFVSEIGFQGCPGVESLERYLTPGERWPFGGSEEWRLHSTAPLPGKPSMPKARQSTRLTLPSMIGAWAPKQMVAMELAVERPMPGNCCWIVKLNCCTTAFFRFGSMPCSVRGM